MGIFGQIDKTLHSGRLVHQVQERITYALKSVVERSNPA
jgi:hypothetical protein